MENIINGILLAINIVYGMDKNVTSLEPEKIYDRTYLANKLKDEIIDDITGYFANTTQEYSFDEMNFIVIKKLKRHDKKVARTYVQLIIGEW